MFRLVCVVAIGIALIAGTYWYYTNDPSYVTAREGEEAYRNGDYATAHELFDKAIQLDNYNRNAIVMRRNAKFAKETSTASDSVETLLAQVDRYIEEGNIREALIGANTAIEALFEVSRRKLGDMARVEELTKLARAKIAKAEQKAPSVYTREARQYYYKEDFRAAFAALQQIDTPDEQARLFMSELAIKIAHSDLEQVFGQARENVPVAEHQLRSILNWLDRVDTKSAFAGEAQELRIKIMNTLEGVKHE